MKAVLCASCGADVPRNGRHLKRNIKTYCNMACRMKKSEGGWTEMSHGRRLYKIILTPPDYKFKSGTLCAGKFVREHVYKAVKALGRELKKGEVVHHIDCDRHNNKNSNLMIMYSSDHRALHAAMGRAWAKEHVAQKEAV